MRCNSVNVRCDVVWWKCGGNAVNMLWKCGVMWLKAICEVLQKNNAEVIYILNNKKVDI